VALAEVDAMLRVNPQQRSEIPRGRDFPVP
jgi:hypothetical protein